MADVRIGYAAMLEQFAPRDLVDWSVAAEAAGFEGIMAADHVQPWVPSQGNVGRNQREWIDAFGREVLPGLTA